MRFSPRQRSGSAVEIDITAMVDVVFLLIVFFLTTSSLVELTRAKLDLPKEAGEEASELDSGGIVINITRAGGLIVESRTLTRAELLARVDAAVEASGPDELDILLRVDRSAPLAHVNVLAHDLMDRGVRGWRIATERPRLGGGR